MKRVASLYLPHWSIDRVRRAERRNAPPLEAATPSPMAPRVTGWRPGARWAKQMPPGYRRLASDDGGTLVSVGTNHRCSGGALVTVHKIGSRVEIAAASPEASALGIEAGMALTQARASVPDLDVHDADPDGDRADLERLAIALARRWTPVVAISDADGLFLDLTGVAHLHGGEEVMARQIVRLLARFGVTARIAIGDTAGAAWAFVRYPCPRHSRESGNPASYSIDGKKRHPRLRGGDECRVMPRDRHIASLTPLPVPALRIDEASIELLRRLGIDTIGALLEIPRAPLVRRFGATIARRLDQTTGAAPEPLDPIIPPEHIAITRRFAEPIATADAIAHWLEGLATDLAIALAEAGQGARALVFAAERVDGSVQTIRIGLARPTRDAPHILRLIARRIEQIDPGFGIDALTLHVRRADPLGPEALGASLAEETTPDLAPLVDTLANRIGMAKLWRHRPIESDVPERSVAPLPPLDPPERDTTRLKLDDVHRLDTRAPDHPWHPRWPRPVRLLRRPERIDHVLAELPDFPPLRFTWRGVTHRVVRGDGPERITGEWWKRSAERDAIRDYFHVEDDTGKRFWLFRRGDGQRAGTGDLTWYMHGTFG